MEKPLLENLLSGDADHWNLAFQWLWPTALRRATWKISSCCGQDAEDVASRSLESLIARVKQGVVKKVLEMEPLLLRITHDQAIDWCRKLMAAKRGGGKVQSVEQLEEDSGKEVSSEIEGSPLDKLELGELGELVKEASSSLNPKEYQLIQAHFMKGNTHTEISETLGIPVGSVGTTIKRALDKLRKAIQPFM